MNETEKEINELNENIAAEPEYAVNYIKRARCHLMEKNYAKAHDDFDKALEVDSEKAFTYIDEAVKFGPDDAWNYVMRGTYLYYSGKRQHGDALDDFNKAIKLDPENDHAYNGRGTCLSESQNYDDSLNDFTKAIEIDPQNAWSYMNRGECYKREGNYEKALSDFDKAIELDPQNASAYLNRGKFYAEESNYEKAKALSDFDKAIELDPQNVWAYANRGKYYAEGNNYEKALSDFDKAIELDPQNVWAYANRGKYYAEGNNYEKALSDFDKAIELDPQNVWAYANRGECYMVEGNYQKALKDLDKVIELDPQNILAYANRSVCYTEGKSYEKALRDFKKVIELDPQNALRYMNRGAYYEREEALRDLLDKAIELDPHDACAYVNRGIFHTRPCSYEEALSDLNKAIELDPQNALAYMNRGNVYLTANKCEEALGSYNKAIELDPQEYKAYGNRGIYYMTKESYVEAIKDFDKFIEGWPQRIEGYANRSNCYQLMGNYAEALNDCNKCIELAPNDADFYLKRGDCYMSMENYAEALNNFNKAIELDPKDACNYQRRGGCYGRMENYGEALNDFNKAIEVDPKNAHNYNIRGDYYMEIENYAEALSDFNEAVRLAPESPLHYLHIVNCYYTMGEKKKSLESLVCFKEKLENDPFLKKSSIAWKMSRKILGKIAMDHSLSFTLKVFEVLLDLKELKFSKNYLELINFLDNSDFKNDEFPENIQSVIHKVFKNYPNFDKSLSEVFKRDGKELFFIQTKLAIIEIVWAKTVWSDFEQHIYFSGTNLLPFHTIIKEERESEDKEKQFKQQTVFMFLYIIINKALQERNVEVVEKNEREKARAEIEHERKLNDLRTNIFQAVSHTISNIMLANKSITKRIKVGTNSVNDVNRLELLNDLVLSTMKAIKLAFSREDIIVSKAPDDLSFEKMKDGISLHDLLYFCMNINMNYLVSGEGEEAWATIRNMFFFINKYDKKNYLNKLSMLKELKKSPHFSISELSEDQIASFVDAFWSEQFQPVHQFFDIQTEDIRNLYVKKDSYTFSVLFIILLELTKNMIRYGTIEDREARKFTMKSETEGDYIVLSLANVCQKSRLNLKESTLKGLAMIQEFSKVLGKFEKAEKNIGDSDFLEFTTRLFIMKPEHQKTV